MGFEPAVFCAPGRCSTNSTNRVVALNSDLTLWLFASTTIIGKNPSSRVLLYALNRLALWEGGGGEEERGEGEGRGRWRRGKGKRREGVVAVY